MNTTSKLGPHTQTGTGTCPGVSSEFTTKATTLELELELIQTQMAQKAVLREGV
jgi:hypothetical protein